MLQFLLAAEAAEGTENELRVLPNADELLWGTLAFGLLALLLIKFVFPKLRTALEERTRRIQGQLEDAERVKRDADTVLEQYRAQLADARAEVQRIIDEGKRTADSLRQEMIQRAEAEAAEIVQRARTEVTGERDRAMQELRSTIGDLSIQIASRVIDREVSTSESQRQLVEQAIRELTAPGNGQRA